jgi:hypothetical protein
MPVILATWEAEIRRIAVQGQPGHIVGETPISKIIRAKRAGGKAQGVELLSSNPSPSKRNLIFFSSCTTPVTTIPLITILALCCTLNAHRINTNLIHGRHRLPACVKSSWSWPAQECTMDL